MVDHTRIVMTKHKYTAPVKMTEQQARTLWNSLSHEQKLQFCEMYQKLNRGELMLANVNVDDNEQIQNIVLEPKEKPSAPAEPFYKHFKRD